MKKIRLELDELEVTTFETAAARDERGTVQGHNRATAAGRYTCFYHCTWNHDTCNEEVTCVCGGGSANCTEALTCLC